MTRLNLVSCICALSLGAASASHASDDVIRSEAVLKDTAESKALQVEIDCKKYFFDVRCNNYRVCEGFYKRYNEYTIRCKMPEEGRKGAIGLLADAKEYWLEDYLSIKTGRQVSNINPLIS